MPRNPEIETEQFLEDIEQLLYSSEFKELESRLKSEDANIWHILGITRKEVLITKFLGWLLNPQEQHNIGSQFLEELITEALKNKNNKHTELSLIRLRLMDLSEVEVKTESQLSKNSRADIIISVLV